jgi:hypothetical protein
VKVLSHEIKQTQQPYTPTNAITTLRIQRRLLSRSLIFSSTLKAIATSSVNQHPPAHDERWMVSGQETVICWVPVP